MTSSWIAAFLFVSAAALPLLAGSGAISAACSGLLLLLALLIGGLKFIRVRWVRSAVQAGVLIVTPLALVLLTIFILIEQGETVVLRTFDETGAAEETRLWVVDFEGSAWLGAGGGDTRRWYHRLQTNPEVEVLRNGAAQCFRASPNFDPLIRDAVIEETRRKYRLGNLGLSIGNSLGIPMRANSIAIPVRLVACG